MLKGSYIDLVKEAFLVLEFDSSVISNDAIHIDVYIANIHFRVIPPIFVGTQIGVSL